MIGAYGIGRRDQLAHQADGASGCGWSWEETGDALRVSRQSLHAKHKKRGA